MAIRKNSERYLRFSLLRMSLPRTQIASEAPIAMSATNAVVNDEINVFSINAVADAKETRQTTTEIPADVIPNISSVFPIFMGKTQMYSGVLCVVVCDTYWQITSLQEERFSL